MSKTKISARTWFNLVIFGFMGQIEWNVENMYFNTFLCNYIYGKATPDAVNSSMSVVDAVAWMVALSAVVAVLTTFIMGNLSDKINNRKVLTGFAEICGFPDKVVDITVAIDKLDKIGLDAVKDEMREKGLGDEAIAILEPVLTLNGTNGEKLQTMRGIMGASQTGTKGLDELEELFGFIAASGISTKTEIDLSLARGLNYYTGAIFEVKALDWQIGSICGGGRYDNLTGIFGLPDMSGVGVSFGADRIYDVLKGLDKFPGDLRSTTKLLFANMGPSELTYILPTVSQLREKGISVEIYPDASKLKKQFDYADRKSIPFLSITGENEISGNVINIKDLRSGEQKAFAKNDIEGMLAWLG